MAASPLNVHLHCAQCDAQLGIFENEWVHLTPSYARPKERGINMGCRIGSRTQVVPQGPTQKEAAGCTMVELFCEKCSSVVGQSCKSTPSSEQQNLLNQRFFKLSRIYLTDIKDERREDPVFVDADNFDNPSRSTSVRSGVVPKQRAVSRGGMTPSFRQSYPPPSSQTPFYDQYQGPQNMPPPRQSFQQIPQSPVLVHYAPPPPPTPSTYPYAHHASRQPTDVPEPYQPFLANGVPELQQEVKGQGVSILECLNRITATERRLVDEERRISDAERRSFDAMKKMHSTEAQTTSLRQRVEQLEKDCESQASRLERSHEVQAKQDRLITAQSEQIASLTETLAGFQATVDELKAQMVDIRSQPLMQQDPRPNSHDFLQNLEVMVLAMKAARAREQEVESLREKNRIMKDRLSTIFAAMGSVSEEDSALLEDHSFQQNQQESPILGKRKRTSDVSEAEQRKLVRRVPSTDARDQSLPTPESTQAGVQSANGRQALSLNSEDHPALQEGIEVSDNTEQNADDVEEDFEDDMTRNPVDANREEVAHTGTTDHFTLQERVALLTDDSQDQQDNRDLVMAETSQEFAITSDAPHDTANIEGEERGAVASNGNEEARREIFQEVSESHSAAPDIHQASAVNESALQALHQQEDQLAYFPRSSRGFRDYSVEPTSSPHGGRQWSVSRSQHPAITYGRIGGPSSMQYSGPSLSHFSTGVLPSPQNQSPFNGSADSQPKTWKRDESYEERTFSHALSRGHRLEDIIQRPPRTSSMPPSDNSGQKQVQASLENDKGSIKHGQPVSSSGTSLSATKDRPQERQGQSDQTDGDGRVRHPQVAEFSDEENVAPSDAKSANSQQKQTTSTTPTGNPRAQAFDRAEVARTIRELTQEPLRRPVIVEPNQMARPSIQKGASQGQQRSVLPSFATAIHNLNDSAARHKASTSPRAAEGDLSTPGRWRWKQPLVSTSPNANMDPKVAETNDKAPIAPEQRTMDPSPSVLPRVAQLSREHATPKPRGRPRKISTTTRMETAPTSSTSENDDNCSICSRRGKLLCCDGCPRSYHHRCVNMDPKQLFEGDWFCSQCTKKNGKKKTSETTIGKPQHNDPVMIMRRKLAEEAMARDMAQKA